MAGMVWVRSEGGDGELLFFLQDDKLPLHSIAARWKLDPATLRLGHLALCPDANGYSIPGIDQIRCYSSPEGLGDGLTQQSPLIISGNPTTPVVVDVGSYFSLEGDGVAEGMMAQAGEPSNDVAAANVRQRREALTWLYNLPPAKRKKLEFLQAVERTAQPEFHFGKALEDVPDEIRRVVSGYVSGSLALKKNEAGVTLFRGLPSLLLHYHDVSTGRLENEVTQSLSRECRTVIMAGPSGCGKTKTLYSYFSTCRGFYFTMTAEGNGGSADLSEMILLLQPLLSLGNYERNRLVVRLHVLLLLASRVVIHRMCAGLSNKKWLLLQVVCRGLQTSEEESSGCIDVFLRMYMLLVEQIPENISNEDMEFNISELYKFVRGHVPHVAVDEAQILLKKYVGCFESESSPGDLRPVSSCLCRAILEASSTLKTSGIQENVLLVCGTGYTLNLHLDLLLSSMVVSKPLPSSNQYLWYGIWERAEDMVTFAQEVVELTAADISYIKTSVYEQFGRGRYRPFVSVVELVLQGFTWSEACDLVERLITTKEEMPGLNIRGKIYDAIKSISKRPDGYRLMQILQRAVIQFYVFGRGLTLGGEDSESTLELMEYGLGVVTKSSLTARCIELSEPFVLLAAKNFFFDAKGPGYFTAEALERLGDNPYGFAQGFLYQHYVPLRFEEIWDEYGGRMMKMPMFEAAFAGIPDEPEYVRLVKRKPLKLVRGLCCVAVHTSDYKTRDFLEDNGPQRKCTTLVCEERLKGGADLVTRFEGGTVFHQCKYLKNSLSRRQFKLAVEQSWVSEPGLLALCGDFVIRMVDIYPQRRPEESEAFWWAFKGGRVILTVILDSSETGESFFKDDCEVLKAIKEEAPVLECFEP